MMSFIQKKLFILFILFMVVPVIIVPAEEAEMNTVEKKQSAKSPGISPRDRILARQKAAEEKKVAQQNAGRNPLDVQVQKLMPRTSSLPKSPVAVVKVPFQEKAASSRDVGLDQVQEQATMTTDWQHERGSLEDSEKLNRQEIERQFKETTPSSSTVTSSGETFHDEIGSDDVSDNDEIEGNRAERRLNALLRRYPDVGSRVAVRRALQQLRQPDYQDSGISVSESDIQDMLAGQYMTPEERTEIDDFIHRIVSKPENNADDSDSDDIQFTQEPLDEEDDHDIQFEEEPDVTVGVQTSEKLADVKKNDFVLPGRKTASSSEIAARLPQRAMPPVTKDDAQKDDTVVSSNQEIKPRLELQKTDITTATQRPRRRDTKTSDVVSLAPQTLTDDQVSQVVADRVGSIVPTVVRHVDGEIKALQQQESKLTDASTDMSDNERQVQAKKDLQTVAHLEKTLDHMKPTTAQEKNEISSQQSALRYLTTGLKVVAAVGAGVALWRGLRSGALNGSVGLTAHGVPQIGITANR